MIDVTAPADLVFRSVTLLDAIAEAYTVGDSSHGEHLLTQALDAGVPWDQVCAAAARGVAQRFGESSPIGARDRA